MEGSHQSHEQASPTSAAQRMTKPSVARHTFWVSGREGGPTKTGMQPPAA
jgi:hypothetical protein